MTLPVWFETCYLALVLASLIVPTVLQWDDRNTILLAAPRFFGDTSFEAFDVYPLIVSITALSVLAAGTLVHLILRAAQKPAIGTKILQFSHVFGFSVAIYAGLLLSGTSDVQMSTIYLALSMIGYAWIVTQGKTIGDTSVWDKVVLFALLHIIPLVLGVSMLFSPKATDATCDLIDAATAIGGILIIAPIVYAILVVVAMYVEKLQSVHMFALTMYTHLPAVLGIIWLIAYRFQITGEATCAEYIKYSGFYGLAGSAGCYAAYEGVYTFWEDYQNPNELDINDYNGELTASGSQTESRTQAPARRQEARREAPQRTGNAMAAFQFA